MSFVKPVQPSLLFLGFLYNPEKVNPENIVSLLKKKFGTIKFISNPINFVWSDYYEKEMGSNLKRIFIVFENTFERKKIIKVKKYTDKLEQKYAFDSRRTINIDPGLICLENFILVTNKPFFHRIYLKDGVYGEVTLFYKKGTYNPIEYWSYPEYRSQIVIEFLNIARAYLSDVICKLA